MKKLVVILCLLAGLHVFGAQLPGGPPRKKSIFKRFKGAFSKKKKPGEVQKDFDIHYLMAVANQRSGNVTIFGVGFNGESAEVGTFRVGETPGSVSFSPNGQLLAVANRGSNNVNVFRVGADGVLTEVGIFPVGKTPVSVSFSPKGQLLAVANRGSNSIKIFGVGSNGVLTEVGTFPVGQAPTSVAFSPNGQLLIVANGGDNNVRIFGVGSNGVLTEVERSPFPLGKLPTSIAFSPGGQLFVVTTVEAGTKKGHLVVFRVEANNRMGILKVFDTGKGPNSVAFSTDEQLLVVSNGLDQSVGVFRVSTEAKERAEVLPQVEGSPFKTGIVPVSVVFSPDSQLLAVANNLSSDVKVFRVDENRALIEVETIKTVTMPASVAFTWSRNYLQEVQAAIEGITDFPTPLAGLITGFIAETKVQIPFGLDEALDRVEGRGIIDDNKYLEVFGSLLQYLINYKFNDMAENALDQWMTEVKKLDNAVAIIEQVKKKVDSKTPEDKNNQEILNSIIAKLDS